MSEHRQYRYMSCCDAPDACPKANAADLQSAGLRALRFRAAGRGGTEGLKCYTVVKNVSHLMM
jgi:hypothetical protein